MKEGIVAYLKKLVVQTKSKYNLEWHVQIESIIESRNARYLILFIDVYV